MYILGLSDKLIKLKMPALLPDIRTGYFQPSVPAVKSIKSEWAVK